VTGHRSPVLLYFICCCFLEIAGLGNLGGPWGASKPSKTVEKLSFLYCDLYYKFHFLTNPGQTPFRGSRNLVFDTGPKTVISLLRPLLQLSFLLSNTGQTPCRGSVNVLRARRRQTVVTFELQEAKKHQHCTTVSQSVIDAPIQIKASGTPRSVSLLLRSAKHILFFVHS